MTDIPAEIAIGGVYFPPLLFVGFIAIIMALVTAEVLNRTGIARWFFFPPLVFVALIVIYSGLIGYSVFNPWYAG